MNRSNLGFLESIFAKNPSFQGQVLVVNQTFEAVDLVSENPKIRVINSKEKGLSKSRNLALQHAQGKIVVISDDDVVFLPNFDAIICEAFSKGLPDVVLFQAVNEFDLPIRKYPEQFKAKLSHLDVLNTHSIEMVLNRSSIENTKIAFDEDFGLGTDLPFGEEAVFMMTAKRSELKLYFFPEPIISHNNVISVANLSNNQVYFVQGALFYRIFGIFYPFWILLKFLFELKQNRIAYKDLFSLFFQAVKGKRHYQKIKNKPVL